MYIRIKKIVNCIMILLIMILTIYMNTTKVKAETIISKENWEEWQKEDYWEWHTRTTTNDKAYNGNHIVIENDVIDFYGYWQNSYKDFLYKDYNKAGKKIFKFRIDESKANYHTLDGAGFIFNANKKDNKISGYILIFRQKDVCLYRIDDIDIEKFETTANTTIATYGKLIKTIPKIDSQIHDLVIEATPTNIKITEGQTEILNQELDYSKHIGDSFGLISSYVQHACSILTKIEFSQLKMIIEDYEIPILNTDMKGTPITGGSFIIKDKNGIVIQEGKTDKNGKLIVKGLKEGIYTVQQKSVPSNYILNNQIYTFKVTNDGKIIDEKTSKEIQIIVKNEKQKIETDDKDNENDSDGKQDNNNYKDDNKNNETNEKENGNKDKIDNNKINNGNNSQIDNTIKKDEFPYAGLKEGVIVTIILLIVSIIILIIKLKQYKQV